MNLKTLVGSGDRIALAVLPFLVIGIGLNMAFPEVFRVGGPGEPLRIVSMVLLVPGVTIWLWSALLILRDVPRGKLITSGPYALVKHPLYTAVALLVLPWAGFLLDTWLGAAVGVVLYAATRIFGPEEEAGLARTFGPRWDAYTRRVKLAWL
jgi:protein-S-isoprenylcysteine O-methyltransferase Ste14